MWYRVTWVGNLFVFVLYYIFVYSPRSPIWELPAAVSPGTPAETAITAEGMGMLHERHLELIKYNKSEGDFFFGEMPHYS